nr:hypothetical protein [uncultured Capnocytophaga sp.]
MLIFKLAYCFDDLVKGFARDEVFGVDVFAPDDGDGDVAQVVAVEFC